MMKLLFVSPVSATIEFDNNEIYYTKNSYDVFINGKIYKKDLNTNVFSLFDLIPDSDYEVKADGKTVFFHTPNVSEIVYLEDIDNSGNTDVTEKIQKVLDDAKENALVVVDKGIYHITSLYVKSNLTINLKKGAVLSGSTIQEEYVTLEGELKDEFGNDYVLGNWEGNAFPMKAAMINVIRQKNVNIVGEGTIDGNAQKSTWWEGFKLKPYARPHIIYINHSENVNVQGINVMNSPQWTIHPFFSENLKFLNLYIENPKISPNTDGLNPQSCKYVDIIGVYFSVGDDCIAIKSGKIDMARKYQRPCEYITIRNCYMNNGHGAVVLGSEMAGGIKNLDVSRCVFDSTDRGLRIKTRRGRGKLAVIDGVAFTNILMKSVLTPLVINMFYYCDPDGRTEYVWSKEKLPVDDRTPYLGSFLFKNLICENSQVCAGYFYGLPEMPIGKIAIEDCTFTFAENAESGEPAMMDFAEVLCRSGFKFYNVDEVSFKNVSVMGTVNDKIYTENVGKIILDEQSR